MKSGETHVKYDHFHFPRKVELKCPNCGNKAIAENKNVSTSFEHFIDISNIERVWEFKCVNCINRKQLTWEDLLKIELWNKVRVKNEIVVAYNKDHLEMILKRLRGENIDNHPWSFFANYINKNWLKRIKKESDFRKIAAYLK